MSPVISETGEARFVDDLEIEQWIHDRFGFVPHPFWIGHCRELYLAETVQESRRAWHQCPPDKRPAIREAFVYFGILNE
ncbi:MAG: hypothetical protein LAP40_26795 [Acidobacteriia bacterium]|nr:hypothetical protein [Terriglobia bacterium]